MVNYITIESRTECLRQGYQTVRGHFDDLADSIGDTISITMGDNWYNHRRSFLDFEQSNIKNTIPRRLWRELHFSEGDSWIDTFPIARREPYDIEWYISSRKIIEMVVNWFPFKQSLEWSSVFIAQRYIGRGIATQARSTLEDVSRELNVNIFCATSITDRHRKYWKRQKDYQMHGNTAFKRLKRI